MAGFRGPLFLLGLGAAALVSQGGYRQPLPVPPLSGTPAIVSQGGYRQPLPVPPLSGTPAIVQAGFIGPMPILNLGAGTAIPPVVPVARGGDSSKGLSYDEVQLARQLREEDDILLALAVAFIDLIQ